MKTQYFFKLVEFLWLYFVIYIFVLYIFKAVEDRFVFFDYFTITMVACINLLYIHKYVTGDLYE
jgi:hypothetical protein